MPAAATVEGSGNPSLSPEPREPQVGWLFIGLFALSLPLLLNGGALGWDAHLQLRGETTPDLRKARPPHRPPACPAPGEMGDRLRVQQCCSVSCKQGNTSVQTSSGQCTQTGGGHSSKCAALATITSLESSDLKAPGL